MARCSPGDSIVCHIRHNALVNIYEEKWDKSHIFDIVSIHGEGYMIYVPYDIILNDSIVLTRDNIHKFNADKRFIDSTTHYITDYKIISIYRKLDGLTCNKCKTFYSMSEANQPDGTLICWSCRKYPHFD